MARTRQTYRNVAGKRPRFTLLNASPAPQSPDSTEKSEQPTLKLNVTVNPKQSSSIFEATLQDCRYALPSAFEDIGLQACCDYLRSHYNVFVNATCINADEKESASYETFVQCLKDNTVFIRYLLLVCYAHQLEDLEWDEISDWLDAKESKAASLFKTEILGFATLLQTDNGVEVMSRQLRINGHRVFGTVSMKNISLTSMQAVVDDLKALPAKNLSGAQLVKAFAGLTGDNPDKAAISSTKRDRTVTDPIFLCNFVQLTSACE